MTDDMIAVENPNSPGKTTRVNRAKYTAMRAALLAVLPAAPPGMTVPAAKAALLPHLPQDLFPMGETAGWWLKCVQLDLEAKGEIKRGPKSPVQLYRSNP